MAAIQQILIGMGGAGSDSYWYTLLSWGSMSGNYDYHHYMCHQGSNDEDNDDIYVAGQRSYYHQSSSNRWQAYYIKLDTEGALQAQISFATGGSYTYTSGTGCFVQKYSDNNYQSGAEQKYVLLSGADNKSHFARSRTSDLEVQGQNSLKTGTSPSDVTKNIVAGKRGFRWSGGTGGGVNNEVMGCFYFCGTVIGKMGFNNSDPNANYNQNDAGKTGQNYSPTSKQVVPWSFAGSTYYRSQTIRGMTFEPGTNSYDPSNNEWDNVAPFIHYNSTFHPVTNANPHYGYMWHIQRCNGFGTFGGSGTSNNQTKFHRQTRSTFGDGNGQSQGIWSGGSTADTSHTWHCATMNNNANDDSRGLLVKVTHNGAYNSGNPIVWTKEVSDLAGEESGYKQLWFKNVEVDDSGCVYVVGYFKPSANRTNGLIIKFNANGTIAWQNIFYKTSNNSNTDIQFYGLELNSLGSIIIFGRVLGSTYTSPGTSGTADNFYRGLTMKVANDGSGTGSYGDFTYEASSFGLGNFGGTWQEYTSTAFNYQTNSNSTQRNYGENKDNNYTANATVSTTTM